MEIKAKFKEDMIEKCYKRKRNFSIRLTCVCFCVLLVLLYFVTPISKVENSSFKGNYYLSNDDIVDIMGVDKKTFLFNVDEELSEDYLTNHPLIKDVEMSVSLFNMSIEIEEISPAAKDDENIYLKDGSVFDLNEFKNVIDDDLIFNLPYILSTNEYYDSFHNETRYILYEMSLIFITKYNIDLDYIHFLKNENNSFFVLYMKPKSNYDKIFDVEDGYIELLFDASCVANYFKSDLLIEEIGDFVKELNSLIDDLSLKGYSTTSKEIKGENKNVKTFYVYLEKVDGTGTISTEIRR